MRQLLVDRVRHEIAGTALLLKKDALAVPTDLLAEHIAGTFVAVLNWWVDTQSAPSPRQTDDLFLSLVGPALVGVARG